MREKSGAWITFFLGLFCVVISNSACRPITWYRLSLHHSRNLMRPRYLWAHFPTIGPLCTKNPDWPAWIRVKRKGVVGKKNVGVWHERSLFIGMKFIWLESWIEDCQHFTSTRLWPYQSRFNTTNMGIHSVDPIRNDKSTNRLVSC